MAYPEWLRIVSWIWLVTCAACAIVIALDFLRGNRQKMWIMHLVWPITALYFGPFAVWLYFHTRPYSLAGLKAEVPLGGMHKKEQDNQPPRPAQVSTAVFHCGAGCTLGDVISEYGLFALGGVAFLAGSEFLSKILVDFLLAYAFGIVFQYFTIVPMRKLTPGKGIAAAARADTVSILAFEIGMFLWMALVYYVLFPQPHLHPNEAVFWFMMQIAMIVGAFTAYPANRWLIRNGWKEKMPQMPAAG